MSGPKHCTFAHALRQPVDQPLHAALAPHAAQPVSDAPAPDEDWADFAKLDFEPWSTDCPIPENSEWIARLGRDAVMLRLAWVMLTKTKPELVEVFAGLDRKDADDLLNGLLDVRDGYRVLADMAAAAMSRGMSAALCAAAEGSQQ